METRAFAYKVYGNTGKGRCACGHLSYKGQPYFILRFKGVLKSVCLKCMPTREGRISGRIQAGEVKALK